MDLLRPPLVRFRFLCTSYLHFHSASSVQFTQPQVCTSLHELTVFNLSFFRLQHRLAAGRQIFCLQTCERCVPCIYWDMQICATQSVNYLLSVSPISRMYRKSIIDLLDFLTWTVIMAHAGGGPCCCWQIYCILCHSGNVCATLYESQFGVTILKQSHH